jgi:hypothetical protein
LDDVNLLSPVYDALHGTPTTPGTNIFTITMDYEITGAVISTNVTILILPGMAAPPVITNQPVSMTNLAGSDPSFSVTAGPQPLAYRWFFNTNTSVPNATNSTLTLTNVQLAQAGYYSVAVSNAGGAITSSPAHLAVWQPPVITSTAALAGSGTFQFTFSPVAGLTNTVQTGSALPPNGWRVLTNIAPPATTNAITVFDKINNSNQFYRIRIVP